MGCTTAKAKTDHNKKFESNDSKKQDTKASTQNPNQQQLVPPSTSKNQNAAQSQLPLLDQKNANPLKEQRVSVPTQTYQPIYEQINNPPSQKQDYVANPPQKIEVPQQQVQFQKEEVIKEVPQKKVEYVQPPVVDKFKETYLQENALLEQQYQQNQAVKKNEKVDPSSLKGLTQTLSAQQMRISKGDKKIQNNFGLNSEESPFKIEEMQDQLPQNTDFYMAPKQTSMKPQIRDNILNKHMRAILSSLKTQESVAQTCYSTPPLPLIDSDQGKGEWIQVETFGVYGSQAAFQQSNFMND